MSKQPHSWYQDIEQHGHTRIDVSRVDIAAEGLPLHAAYLREPWERLFVFDPFVGMPSAYQNAASRAAQRLDRAQASEFSTGNGIRIALNPVERV